MKFVNDGDAHITEIDGVLKPCPFCGSEACLHKTWTNSKHYYVSCIDSKKIGMCRIQQSEYSFNTIESAVKAWNTRT